MKPMSDGKRSTKMSDLIKRSDAIKVLKDSVVEMGSDDFCEMGVHIDDIEAVVNAIPSADRPSGEWIDAEIPLECGGSMPIQVCNLCKTFYPLAYTGGGHRFCPNCGARMKGAANDFYSYGERKESE